jgi:hypothetical protein
MRLVPRITDQTGPRKTVFHPNRIFARIQVIAIIQAHRVQIRTKPQPKDPPGEWVSLPPSDSPLHK